MDATATANVYETQLVQGPGDQTLEILGDAHLQIIYNPCRRVLACHFEQEAHGFVMVCPT